MEEAGEIKACIQQELDTHLRRLRDIHRPDLKDEEDLGVRPDHPIFHDLEPHFFPSLESIHLKPEDLEKHRRNVSVEDLLTTQLEESAKILPNRILIVGRPESGKTALFANLIHLWLHDKKMIRGMIGYDALIAIQCLGLQPPKDTKDKANIDLQNETLQHLPDTCRKYGSEKVSKVMKDMEILLLVDSLDELPEEYTMDESSFPGWNNACVVLFSGLEFMTEKAHSLRYRCDENHLVLRLWGGLAKNPTEPPRGATEPLADLSGGLSGLLFERYCQRLCEVHGKNYDEFMEYLKKIMKTLPLEMRKPFNTYVAFNGWKISSSVTAKTVSEISAAWLSHWTRIYKSKLHNGKSDALSISKESTDDIGKLAYKAFAKQQRKIVIKRDDLPDFEEKEAFFSHVLVTNHTPNNQMLTFTFRILNHQLYFAAQYIKKQLELEKEFATLIPLENWPWWRPLLPMVLGVTRDLQREEIHNHVCKLVENHNREFERDPIVNYMVQVLGETGLYNRINGKFDPFVELLLKTLHNEQNNWHVKDGNLLPEALKALCECGRGLHETEQETEENKSSTPQRLTFNNSGLLRQTPGLSRLVGAITRCNIRVSLLLESTLSGVDEEPVDEIVKALQTKGRASLGKLSGCLRNVSILDTHPATRRIYSLNLRLRDHKQYEALQQFSRSSNKLTRITLRIPNVSEMKVKKMKEAPASITHLSLYLEGVTDDTLGAAIGAWRAIRGNISRRDKEYLRFWSSEDKNLTASGVIQVIDADLPAKQIEVPLDQPVADFDQERIQNKLDNIKGKEFIVRLLGSSKYPRKDLKTKRKEVV